MTHHEHGHGAGKPPTDPVIPAYRRANDKMHVDMAVELTGHADLDFIGG
jgi:hypothetical protein